jgi:hypothetical protein
LTFIEICSNLALLGYYITLEADMEHTTRQPRGRQAKPTKAEVSAAWVCIRNAAAHGDIQASALLIALSEGRPALHVDGGILNLPGHGGWAGENPHPKKAVLATIRESDPQSKQLPENQ